MKNKDLIQVTFSQEELTENNAHLDALLTLEILNFFKKQQARVNWKY